MVGIAYVWYKNIKITKLQFATPLYRRYEDGYIQIRYYIRSIYSRLINVGTV